MSVSCKFIKILQEDAIPYYWQTMYVGLKIGVFNSDVSLLVSFNVDGYSEKILLFVMKKLNQRVPILNDDIWNQALRVIRYIRLRSILQEHDNNDELTLEQVEEVYADMNYPSDMAHLIYYMPPTDGYNPSLYSIEFNRKRLVELLKTFLVYEKSQLQ